MILEWLIDHWLIVWLSGIGILYLPGLKIAAVMEDDAPYDRLSVLGFMFWTATVLIFWPIIVSAAIIACACLPVYGLGYLIINSGKKRKKLA